MIKGLTPARSILPKSPNRNLYKLWLPDCILSKDSRRCVVTPNVVKSKSMIDQINKNKDFSDDYFGGIFISCGAWLISWIVFIFIITFAFLIFKISLNPIILLFSGISSTVFIFIMNLNTRLNYKYLTRLSVVLIFIIASLFLFWKFSNNYDLSYDGQGYQQQAILNISNGWNPYYYNLPDDFGTTTLNVWATHYPKALWYVQSTFYLFTGNIELSKFINLVLIFSSFLLCLGVFLNITLIRKWLSLSICLLLFINPLTIGQSLGTLNDHVSFALLMAVMATLLNIYHKRTWIADVLFVMISIFVVNIKFTNLIYLASLLIFALVTLIIIKKQKVITKLLLLSLFCLLLSVVVFGWNPYINNLVKKGNMFYPTQGKGAIISLNDNVPGNLLKSPSYVRFFYGIYSQSIQAISDKPMEHIAKLKIPFTVKINEINAFYNTNIRAGGFGPWFSGIFTISLILLSVYIYYIVKDGINDTQNILICLFFCSICITVSSLNPIGNLARYVPLVWTVPVAILLLIQLGKLKLLKIISAVFLLTGYFVNIILVSIGYYSYQTKTNIELKTQLHNLSIMSNDRTLLFSTNRFLPLQDRLKNYGVKIEAKSNQTCKKSEYLVGSFKSASICTDYKL